MDSRRRETDSPVAMLRNTALAATFLLALASVTCRRAAPRSERAAPPAPSSVVAPRASSTAAAPASASARPLPSFELPPPPPAWRAAKGTRSPSRYCVEQFCDCTRPTPISGWQNAKDDWSIVAYACAEPYEPMDPPEPWLSDGSYFLYGGRGDVVIEVVAHLRRGPRPYQFRRYVDEALDRIGPAPARGDGKLSAPDHARAGAVIAEMRKIAKVSPIGPCKRELGEQMVELGNEQRGFATRPPGVFEVAILVAISCTDCERARPAWRREECGLAMETLDDAADWLRRHAP